MALDGLKVLTGAGVEGELTLADSSLTPVEMPQDELPALVQRGYGVCAMKTLAGSGFTNRGAVRVVPNLISVEECLQFVWSLPVSTLISGPDNAEQFAQTISYAKRFKALDDEARKGLIAKVAGVAGRGVEYYKV